MRVGKKGVEWAMMSVCLCSPSWNRIAIPRGLEVGSVSGMVGRPVEEEKRIVRGVEGEVK